MPRKKDFLRIIDQETAVTGGGGLIQQQVQVAPPIPGAIPSPTALVLVGSGIARSSQAPMAYIDLSWTAPARATPDYYIIEYTKNTFDNAVRLRANETTARILVDISSTYYVRVQAVYRSSVSDWSNTLTVNTPADNTAPTDVSSVVATFINGDVVITWTEPSPTDETYKDARIRVWNAAKTVLHGTYHTRGGSFIWTEAENLRLVSGGTTSVAVDVTSRGWNNVYGSIQNASAAMANPVAPTGLTTDFTTGDLIISWTNPVGIPYRDIEVKLYESSSKITNYKTYYLSGNSVTFTKEDNFAATSNNPDTSIYIEIKTRGWLGLFSTATSTTATHVALATVSSASATFIAGDLLVTWVNPNVPYKDIEVKIYESASKAITYKTYYIMGNSIIFTQADNYAVNGSTPDTSLYVEIKTRTWLGVLSTAATGSATLTAPNPVTSVVTDFTTGDLQISWTNPTNTSYRDVEVKLYESASKVTNYKTYYTNSNRITFTAEDNFAAVAAAGGTGADINIYYEITVRSWLGVVSSIVTGSSIHPAPSAVDSIVVDFTTGDLELTWTNPSTVWKHIQVRLYSDIGLGTLYRLYQINTNKITFTAEDNFVVTANNPDPTIFYSIEVVSKLDLVSTALAGTATHVAPAPVSAVVADFTTGDLGITWTNPAGIWKDIEVKIYESASKAITYKTYYIQGNRITFTVEDNFIATANNPDASLYYEIKSRSKLNLLSAAVSASITKAVPVAPANLAHTWTGDDGTFPADVIFTWDKVEHVKSYKITINGLYLHETTDLSFAYTYEKNVADHSGSSDYGDYGITFTVQGRDRLNQVGIGTTDGAVFNSAPPSSSIISITSIGGFSTIGAFVTLTKPIKDLMHYVYELHNDTSVVQTVKTSSQIVSFEGILSATYTIKVHAVDLFNRDGATITSNSVVVDALTIEELRAEAKYTDSQSRSSPTLDVLKDDLTAGTISYFAAGAGVYNWTKIERPTVDRYGIVTFYSAVSTEVYIGLSKDDITYTWYSGPITDKGSNRYVLTNQTTEALAKTNDVALAAATRYSLQIPALTDARFIKVWHRHDPTDAYTVAEIYPRRILQSDDIEAETIKGINILAATITGDHIFGNTVSAVKTNTGTLVVNTGGHIRSGQTAFDTGSGYYLGTDAPSTAIFSLGTSDRKLLWDGANLYLLGSFIIRTATTAQKVEITAVGLKGYDSSGVVQVQIDTADGKLKAAGGAVIADVTGIQITSGGNIRSGQTAYNTGTGFYLGNDSSVTKFSIGSPSGPRLLWDGTNLAYVSGSSNSILFDQTGIIMSSGGLIRSGQTAYDTGTGFYLGNDGGTPKLSIGNSAGTKLTWNGSILQLIGSGLQIATSTASASRVVIDSSGLFGIDGIGNVQVGIYSSDGKIWAAGGAVKLDSTGIIVTSGGNARSGQTAYDTGTGWWIGNDGGTVKASIGNSVGTKLLWDGSNLTLQGSGLIVRTGASMQRVQLTYTGLKGYDSSDVEQVSIDSTDGKFKAAGGDVFIDAAGIALKSYDNAANPGFNSTRAITWRRNTDDTRVAFMQTDWYTYASGTKTMHYMYINAESPNSNTNGAIQLKGTSGNPGSIRSALLALDGATGTITGRADSYDFQGVLYLQEGVSSFSDRIIMTDTYPYADGSPRTFNIHFRAKNGDSIYTNNSATIKAIITPQAGITVPKSSLSFYTASNTEGHTLRLTIADSGDVTINKGLNVGTATTATTGQILANGGATRSQLYLQTAHTSGPLMQFMLDAAAAADRVIGATNYVNNAGSAVGQILVAHPGTDATKAYMRFYVTGADRLRIIDSGTVLIGKTSGLTGAGELDVNGRARADTFETSAGNKWKFNGYTGTILAISGYVTVNIDGTDRKLAVVS